LKILIKYVSLYWSIIRNFGHADQLSDGLINHFNIFLGEIKDEEEHQIELVSREGKVDPSTFFFLSKLGVKLKILDLLQITLKNGMV
jgi:hypothetical protein